MDIWKRVHANTVLTGVFTIIVGILFCFNPYGTTGAVTVIAGIILLCSGLSDIVRHFTDYRVMSLLARSGLALGILKCVLGIFTFSHTEAVMTLFSYIFSLFIIVNGVSKIENAMMLSRAKVSGWAVNLILAILMVMAGFYMLFAPDVAVATVSVWVGIILIADGIMTIATMHRIKSVGSGIYRSVKDAIDEIEGNIIDQ